MFSDIQLLFNKRERLQLFFLLMGSIIMAFMEVIGVASVLPFMSIVLNPESIFDSKYLNMAYNYLNFADTNKFLIFFGFIVLILLALSNIISALMYWAITFFSKMQGHRLGMYLLNNYLLNPYIFFLNRNTSDLAKNILTEVDRVVKGVVLQALQGLSKLILTVVVMMLLVIVNPVIAFSSLIVIGGAYTIFFLVSKKYLSKIGSLQSEATFQRYRAVDEAMLGIKEIKLHSLESQFIKRFEQPSIDNARFSAIGLVIAIIPRYLLETLAFGGIIIIVIFMLDSQQDANEIIPLLSLCALAGYRLLPAIQNIYSAQSMIKYNLSPLRTIVNDLKKVDISKAKSVKLNENFEFKKSIKLKNISFSYPKSDDNILHNINIEIPKNSSIGFVGSTGSGKTTLIDVILGLLSEKNGSISVDGKKVNKENMHLWQNLIGYVPQNIFLIDDSIEANIAFGVDKRNIDTTKLKNAIKLSNLNQMISKLAMKEKTIVGQNGVRLSGGQRQRIGIARALYNYPEIIVLDEATSSLDGLTENYVMDSIESLSKEVTTIIIAHRLSTIKECDCIYFIQNGQIENYGTYNELYENNQEFRKMTKN